MPEKALKILLLVLGTTAVLIGSAIFLFGADRTAGFSNIIVSLLWPGVSSVKGLAGSNVDSELRFYAVFWIAYGVILVLTANDFLRHFKRVPVLLLLFFLGGIGRSISYYSVGAPHLLFLILLVIELAVPPVLFVLWLVVKRDRYQPS